MARAALRSNDVTGQPKTRFAPVMIGALAVWLAIVLFTANRHEFWRDEVRALSLVRAAASPLELYDLIQYDGHPVLWYALLYVGTAIRDSPLVLPAISITVGFAAVALFLWYAPFPLYVRMLFIFGALPLYEYSVVARNYGISMLLMFVAAHLYKTRSTHPYRLAASLALLANTNVHSAVLVGVLTMVWGWEIAFARRRDPSPGRLADATGYLPLLLVAAGLAMCGIFTLPRENTILTHVHHVGVADVGAAVITAALRPDWTFSDLYPGWLPWPAAVLVLFGALAGLIRRPDLLVAGFAAQIVLGVIFIVVYPGWYRHQGLYLMFLVILYWIYFESSARETTVRTAPMRLGYGALLVLIMMDVIRAPQFVWADLTGTRSSSAALAAFLSESGRLREAMIVPDPGFSVESLPYYTQNPIYFPREGRFGTTVSWTTASKRHLTLGELLAEARRIQTEFGKPALIVLPPLNLERPSEQQFEYGAVLSWNSADADEFRRQTVLLREFDATAGDEDYRVFALR